MNDYIPYKTVGVITYLCPNPRLSMSIKEDWIISYGKCIHIPQCKHHLQHIIIIVDVLNHDDVIQWKHFLRYWPFVRGIHRSPVNSLHKGQWRGALVFSLICTWINDWVNSRDAGDLNYNSSLIIAGIKQTNHNVNFFTSNSMIE